jgi:Na+-driven multidrug efflux pump
MQMFLKLPYLQSDMAFRTIRYNKSAANQIALSLASFTFMFAMGLKCCSKHWVGNQKGLDYKQLRIISRFFLLAILLESVFALVFIVFTNIYQLCSA